MFSRSRRAGSSSDLRLFDPLEWAEIGLAAQSLAAAWEAIDRRLVASGHERSTFIISVRFGDTDFPSRTSQVGTMVSREFEAFRRDHYDQFDDPVANRLTRGDCLVPVIGEHPDADVVDEFAPELWDAMASYGFKGGYAASFHDRKRGTLAALLTCSVTSRRDIAEIYDNRSSHVRRATLYFAEAIALRDVLENIEPPILSPREEECLTWASAGRTTQQIADQLGLADRTVDEYIANATRKLGATNRTHACARATLLSLITP